MGSEVINFYVQAFPPMRVIGRAIRTKDVVELDDTTITGLLENMKSDGSFDFLLALPGRLAQSPDTVGWMGDFQPGDEYFTYLAGVLVQPNTLVPDGYDAREIAACDMAVAWIGSNDSAEGGDMMANASGLMSKAKQAHGYEYDGSNGFFEMEYYSYERFHGPVERGAPPVLDFYSPCKKVIAVS